jgi:predicted RNase H-like nuclease
MCASFVFRRSPGIARLYDLMRAAGVDGCRAGWVVATVEVTPRARLRVVVTVEPLLRPVVERLADGGLAALGIDMPIGLPDSGPRSADVEARARLGPRRASLFPTPPRAVLGALDYTDALERSRAATGRGISRQAFHLLPKMREVAAAARPELQPALCEVHPETSFAALGGAPCRHPKRTPAGRAERVALLAPVVDGLDAALAMRTVGVAADDVLDACVAAWTAARVAAGTAEWLGDPDARDAAGLHLTIAV